MWKKILAAQVMWVGVTGVAFALSDDQKRVLDDFMLFDYLTASCTVSSDTAKSDQTADGAVEKSFKDGLPDNYKALALASAQRAKEKYSNLTDEERCEKIAPELFGLGGTRQTGWVYKKSYYAAPARKVEEPPEEAEEDVKPRIVAGVDLALSPRKWIGEYVEMKNMRCMHADKNEYRCIGSASDGAVIFAAAITPSEQQSYMERECGTFAEMASAKCRFTLRFTPDKHDQDVVSGYQKRTIIMTSEIEAIRAAPQGKRRR